jgi:hypothetical protein
VILLALYFSFKAERPAGQRSGEPWPRSGDLTLAPRRLGREEIFVWTDDRSADLVIDPHHQPGGTVGRASLLGPPLRTDDLVSRVLFGGVPEPAR